MRPEDDVWKAREPQGEDRATEILKNFYPGDDSAKQFALWTIYHDLSQHSTDEQLWDNAKAVLSRSPLPRRDSIDSDPGDCNSNYHYQLSFALPAEEEDFRTIIAGAVAHAKISGIKWLRSISWNDQEGMLTLAPKMADLLKDMRIVPRPEAPVSPIQRGSSS